MAACNYLGINYILTDPTPGIGASTTPGTNSQVWYPLYAASPSDFFLTWLNTRDYVCMLPWLVTGQSNKTQVFMPYIEGGNPGHAGGTSGSPLTAATIYGGQSQWTRTSRRIDGSSLTGASVATQGNIARIPSLVGTSEITDFGTYTECGLGEAAGQFLRRRVERGGEVNYTERLSSSGDIVLERVGMAIPPLMRIGTHLTTLQNGRGAADPYSVGFAGFVLVDPSDANNNRHVNCGTAPPTSGGPYAKGERIWNIDPGPGKPEYWVCVTTGSPGTWLAMNVTPFQRGEQLAMGANTAETVLATLTVPAGLLGPRGSVRVDVIASMTNNANTKTLRARLGGLGGFQFWSQDVNTQASTRGTGRFTNRNALNSQVAYPGASFGNPTSAVLPGSINPANAQDIVITGQQVASGDNLAVESLSIELFPAV
jgi:hypothetical protein